MNSFTIRRANIHDASALAELAARTFAETFGADNSPEDLDEHLRAAYGVVQQTAELEDPNVATLLALFGEDLVGFAQVRRKVPPDCVTAKQPIELHRFYLVRSAQGTGLAAALMHASRHAAEELGGLHIWLGVWEHNPKAIAFYRKTGFTVVGSHVFMVGSDPQTDLVLLSRLSHQDESAA